MEATRWALVAFREVGRDGEAVRGSSGCVAMDENCLVGHGQQLLRRCVAPQCHARMRPTLTQVKQADERTCSIATRWNDQPVGRAMSKRRSLAALGRGACACCRPACLLVPGRTGRRRAALRRHVQPVRAEPGDGGCRADRNDEIRGGGSVSPARRWCRTISGRQWTRRWSATAGAVTTPVHLGRMFGWLSGGFASRRCLPDGAASAGIDAQRRRDATAVPRNAGWTVSTGQRARHLMPWAWSWVCCRCGLLYGALAAAVVPRPLQTVRP